VTWLLFSQPQLFSGLDLGVTSLPGCQVCCPHSDRSRHPGALVALQELSAGRNFVEPPSLVGCSLGANSLERKDFMDRMDLNPA
jgi:hypothetical protein